MDGMHFDLISSVERGGAESGLPPRMLRHLFVSRQVGAQSRVLVMSPAPEQLADFLQKSGVAADPVCLGSCAAIPARRHLSDADAVGLPVRDNEYDLVLALNLQDHCGNLLDVSSLRATANLLSAARPGGELVIVQRIDALNSPDFIHRRSCYALHLACFTGQTRVAFIPDGWLCSGTWNGALGSEARPGYLTATLRLPEEQIVRSQWLGMVQKFLGAPPQFCCHPGQNPQLADDRRTA